MLISCFLGFTEGQSCITRPILSEPYLCWWLFPAAGQSWRLLQWTQTQHSLGAGLGFVCYCPSLGRPNHPQRAATEASCPEATLLPSLAPGSSIPGVSGQGGGFKEAVTSSGDRLFPKSLLLDGSYQCNPLLWI